jgi:hypothetical protein
MISLRQNSVRNSCLGREMKSKVLSIGCLSLFIFGCAGKSDFVRSENGKPSIGINLLSAADRKVSTDVILLSPSSASDERAFGPQQIFLANMHGEILKTWEAKRTPGHSRLRSDGLMLSMLLSVGGPRLTSNGGECNELVGLDKNSRETFSLPIEGLSHDFVPIGLDKVALLKFDKLSAKEVKDFFPKSEMEFAYSDKISLIDYQGKEEWSWSLKDHVRGLNLGRLNGRNVTVSTANSIQYVAENVKTKKPAFLVSFRNLDLVLLIEYPSGKILWRSPQGQLSRQHDATILGDRVLVFNNNLMGLEVPSMQIIEWNIKTGERTFFWQPPAWAPLTTAVMGGVRRLSNGSYLVSNSIAGNLFEVDPSSGRVVWSELVTPAKAGRRIWTLGVGFFRAEVYTAEEIAASHVLQ